MATEEALAGPRSGGRDGDPHGKAVEAPGRAGGVAEVVRQAVRRIGVEGAHERQHPLAQDVPTEDRGNRLVDVHDVVASGAQLTPKCRHRARGDREVGDRTVRTKPDRPPQRDDPVVELAALRRRAAMRADAASVIRIERRDDARLVSRRAQVRRQRSDVARDPARIGPRVGRDQRDSHGDTS